MLTARGFVRNTFRCGFYEGQDVLLDIDDVDLIYVEPGKAYQTRINIQKNLIWHDFTHKIVSTNLSYQPIKLTREYDLFIAYLPYWTDLIHLSAVRGWKEHCRTSICWIDELWTTTLQHPKSKAWLSVLRQFDHIAVGLAGTVRPLAEAIGRVCHFVPGAVDAIRFSPYPNVPERVIDVYSIGRRLEGIHRVLLNLSARKEIFYVHDTLENTGIIQVPSYTEHRDMYANMAKRSRFFMVATGKMDVSDETSGQVALGSRYFEGSAAGAILVGQIPDCEEYHQYFDWPQAVIEIQPDGSDTAEVISKLLAKPQQLWEMSCRNAEEALRRHDWVYRWREMLGIAGLEPTTAMQAREKRLAELAQLAKQERQVNR